MSGIFQTGRSLVKKNLLNNAIKLTGGFCPSHIVRSTLQPKLGMICSSNNAIGRTDKSHVYSQNNKKTKTNIIPAVPVSQSAYTNHLFLNVNTNLTSHRSYVTVNQHHQTRATGDPATTDFSIFFTNKNKTISPWHDITLVPQEDPQQGIFQFVNEIPLGTRAKYEVATKEINNPIKQDVKKGKLRFFTYGDIPFNYGCFPQTWEDPTSVHHGTGFPGDNDPLDVVEISKTPIPTGSVMRVKVLGVIAMIDENETDWKIIAIAESNPLAELLHDISDVDNHLPGMISSIREWFRSYKTTDGKPENKFAFDEKALPKGFAHDVIADAHQHWKDLIAGKKPAGKLSIPKDS